MTLYIPRTGSDALQEVFTQDSVVMPDSEDALLWTFLFPTHQSSGESWVLMMEGPASPAVTTLKQAEPVENSRSTVAGNCAKVWSVTTRDLSSCEEIGKGLMRLLRSFCLE